MIATATSNLQLISVNIVTERWHVYLPTSIKSALQLAARKEKCRRFGTVTRPNNGISLIRHNGNDTSNPFEECVMRVKNPRLVLSRRDLLANYNYRRILFITRPINCNTITLSRQSIAGVFPCHLVMKRFSWFPDEEI